MNKIMRETVLSAALDNMATFPDRVAGSSGVRHITPFEEGWNAALTELERSVIKIGTYLASWGNFKDHYTLFDNGIVRVEYDSKVSVFTKNDVEVFDSDLPLISKMYADFGLEGINAWEYTRVNGIPRKGFIEETVDIPSKWQFNDAIAYLTKIA